MVVSTTPYPAPKDPSDLPPWRITWIIMGTLLAFLVLLLAMYYLKNYNLFMCDLDLDCLIDYLSSCGQCIARCVSIPFNWQQSGYRGRGSGYRRGSFHLTPTHDIDNDIDNDMSSGDVELSIHYSGMTIERRKSEYLMDEDHLDAIVTAARPRRTSIRSNSFDINIMEEGLESRSRSNTSIYRINSNSEHSSGSGSDSSFDQDGSPLLMSSLNRSISIISSTFSPLQHPQSDHIYVEAINEQSPIDEIQFQSPIGNSFSSSSSTTYNPLSLTTTSRSTVHNVDSPPVHKTHHSLGAWGAT